MFEPFQRFRIRCAEGKPLETVWEIRHSLITRLKPGVNERVARAGFPDSPYGFFALTYLSASASISSNRVR
jgi:hypothetical protein